MRKHGPLLALTLAALTSTLARNARANSCTWTPTGGDTLWSTPANWLCTGLAGPPGSGDTAIFPAADPATLHNVAVASPTQAIRRLEIAGDYSFTSVYNGSGGFGALTIEDSVVATSGGFTLPITLTGPTSWSCSASGMVYVGDTVSFAPGASITSSGPGTLTMTGSLVGPGSITGTGGGGITISGEAETSRNSYDGGTKVSSGVLEVEVAQALGTGPVEVTCDASIEVPSLGGYVTLANAMTLDTVASPAMNVVVGTALTGPMTLVTPVWIQSFSPGTNYGSVTLLSGPISSTSGGAVLSLSGQPFELANPDNSYDGGTVIFDTTEVLADHDHAFGTGPVSILSNDAGWGTVALAENVNIANAIQCDSPGEHLQANLYSKGDASISGPITGAGCAFGAYDANGVLVLSGTLSGGAPGQTTYTINGGGTVSLALQSPATFQGDISNTGGTLDLGPTDNEIPASTSISMPSDYAVLVVRANTSLANVASLASGARVELGGGAILTLATGSGKVVAGFAGTMEGDGGLTLTGDGGGSPLSTAAVWPYSGPTFVEGAVAGAPTVLSLYADGGVYFDSGSGSIPNSTITVARGGRLELGTGSSTGPMIGLGGTIVPGYGASKAPEATTASLSLSEGTTFVVTYGGSAPGATSCVAVSGAVSLGDASLEVTATSDVSEGPVVVVDNRSGKPVLGTFAGLPEGASVHLDGGPSVLVISYKGGDGDDVTLQIPGAYDAGPTSPPDAAPVPLDGSLSDAAPGPTQDGGPTSDASLSSDSSSASDSGLSIDSAVLSDAGVDATPDVPTDSSSGDGSSDAIADSSSDSPVDAASDAQMVDAMASDGATDAVYADGALAIDSGAVDAALRADSGTANGAAAPPTTSSAGGCGCTTAGSKPRFDASLLALAALAVTGARRRRRGA